MALLPFDCRFHDDPPVLAKHLPHYDRHAFTEAPTLQWSAVLADLDDLRLTHATQDSINILGV